MQKIKRGDCVTRKSYGNDVIFSIKRIIKLSNKKEIAILKGIYIRIEADAPIEDLQIVNKQEQEKYEKELEERIINRSQREKIKKESRRKEVVCTGRILHLDGDTHLSNPKKYSNINTSEQVIFNHNKNNVSKIKIHYFF